MASRIYNILMPCHFPMTVSEPTLHSQKAVSAHCSLLTSRYCLLTLHGSVSNRYTDFSPRSQFAPFFSEMFRPQLILRKDVSPPVIIFQEDVSHPNHISERRFAPKSYFRKTFRTQIIFQKDVSHLNHISERRFAYKSYLGNTFRTHFIFWKDVSPLNQKKVSPPIVIFWKHVSHPFHN